MFYINTEEIYRQLNIADTAIMEYHVPEQFDETHHKMESGQSCYCNVLTSWPVHGNSEETKTVFLHSSIITGIHRVPDWYKRRLGL